MKKYLKNQKGGALVLVLLVMLVLVILGSAVLRIAVSENKFSKYNENKIQAYYIARSGAVAVAEHLIQLGETPSGLINKTSKINKDIADGEFTVSVNQVGNDIFVTAESLYNGVKGVAKLRLNDEDQTGDLGGIFDYPLVAKSNIKGTNGVPKVTIDMTPPAVAIIDENGTVEIEKKSNDITVIKDKNLSMKDFIADERYIQIADINSPDTLMVEENEVKYYKTKKFDLTSTSEKNRYVVTGGGTVHLFVEDSINLLNAHLHIEGNTRFYVYYNGKTPIIFKGHNDGNKNKKDETISSAYNNFLLYAPNTIVKWESAKTPSIRGAIYAKEILLMNNITFTYVPTLMDGVDIDKTFSGVDFEGYTWID